MKFTFDRDAMIHEISIAQEVISNKSPISILSNILLIAENNSLIIKATDSTVKFSTVIPIDIQEEGRTTLYCDKFMSILSSIPSGDVDFVQEDIGVTVENFTVESVAFIVKELFSAINKIFERIEIGLLFEITSCAIDISWIIASLSNVNFI